jgi:glycosyltransferase involved in cell wall biosynthesis
LPNRLHIGVLSGRQPYPNGMAGTQRIHLMARAMAEAGSAVNVWVDGLDRWTEPRNSVPVGVKDGIPFEYLLGKTQASPHRWRRVMDRVALALATKRKLTLAASNGSLDGLYCYTSVSEPALERLVIRNVARLKGFPVVLDIREAPWTFKSNQSIVEKVASPLWGADGAICISGYLEDWVHHENSRTGRNVQTIYVPILTDTDEIAVATSPPTAKSVLFAGSPAYDDTLNFLLAAMELVWTVHSDCQLVVTGGTTEAALGLPSNGRCAQIRCAGFVERSELLREYRAASVLAIPLFDDVRSHARFPTKLGEYLASGRPVVTNRVGEIPRFLENGLNACVTEPGDTAAYAGEICRLLEHPDTGHTMGRNGRQVAERHFHYANYGARLCEFFASLSISACA